MAARLRFPTLAFTLLFAALGSGCAGGPLAQQIASSIATRMADKVVSDIVDEQLRKEREPPNIILKDMGPDPYMAQMLLMQFPDNPPPQTVVEPLPAYVPLQFGDARVPTSRLVPVETWNLIIGQEKQAVLERSLRNGSTILPDPVEWSRWQLATGALEDQGKSQVNFLVPPDLGRLNSGDHVIVEITNTGGLHIARYRSESSPQQDRTATLTHEIHPQTLPEQ